MHYYHALKNLKINNKTKENKMRVSLKGVSSENPNEFIKTAGTYTLKIVEVSEDGYNTDGDQKIKFSFKTPDGKNHNESFSYDGKFAWRFKRFAEAMKAPDDFNVEDFVGRYVVADMVLNAKGYANTSEFRYAVQNDKIAPFPEYKSDEDEASEEAEELF